MRRRGRPRHPDVLTPREWEVLALIGKGSSNHDIARELQITERTAKYHVSEILSKLGVSSREEAVAAVERRGERVGVLGHLALALKMAAPVAAVGVLAGVAFLGWSVLRSAGDDEGVPAAMSLENVYLRALAGATRTDRLLHTTIEVRRRSVNDEGPYSFIEAWIDAGADAVRAETHIAPTFDPVEGDGEDLIISAGEFDYYENAPGDAYRVVVESTCPGTFSAALRVLLACGGNPGSQPHEPRVVARAEWEGVAAVAVIMIDETIIESNDIPAFPSALPTSAPNPTAGQVTESPPPTPVPTPVPTATEYDFRSTTYLDPATFLPIAGTYEYEYRGSGEAFTYTMRYEHEFIERSSVPDDFFDPASIGWRG